LLSASFTLDNITAICIQNVKIGSYYKLCIGSLYVSTRHLFIHIHFILETSQNISDL
jgi:hypothetical protein